VLEEGRDNQQRRGLRPEVALDRQGGAVGGEVDRSVNHDATIFALNDSRSTSSGLITRRPARKVSGRPPHALKAHIYG